MYIFTPSKSGVIYWAIHALIWGNLAAHGSAMIAFIVECIPEEKIWNPLYHGGHCINRIDVLVATGAINVASDILIFLLPLWAILQLHMAPKRKLGVTAVFATGVMYVLPPNTTPLRFIDSYSQRICFKYMPTCLFNQALQWSRLNLRHRTSCSLDVRRACLFSFPSYSPSPPHTSLKTTSDPSADSPRSPP